MATSRPKNEIKPELLQVLSELNQKQQQKILDFAKNLQQQNLITKWDSISDEEAALLKAEFAEEDLKFAEAALTDYLPSLKREDKIECGEIVMCLDRRAIDQCS